MQYEIKGETLPILICNLENGEKMITESGSMAWMSPNMIMETSSNGGLGKVLERALAGESMFQNVYTANGAASIAFASSFPGSIRAIKIEPGNELIAQKSAFLASEPGVQLSVHFQKKLSSGFFGGEGFIMQRLSGNGMAFIEIDGQAVEYELGPNQSLIVDTGYLAAMSATCTMEVENVKGIKNVMFGGEGLFNTRITGPGKVILQTHPISAIASSIKPYVSTK